MLHARSEAGEHQTGTERDEPARQAHHDVARGRDQRRSDQHGPAAAPTRPAVAGHLKTAHRAVVEAAQHREGSVVEPELPLPDREQHVDQVRAAVVHQVDEAGPEQGAPSVGPAADDVR